MADSPETIFHARIETAALVVAYAMSRLDAVYLTSRGVTSWVAAFREAGTALGRLPSTFKNLRDEFDPFLSKSRMGWHKRALRASRQRVMDELEDVSDDALLVLVDRIVANDQFVVGEAIDSLAVKTNIAHNVAERLLTGRRAEDYFLEHCKGLVNVEQERIIDMRNAAAGYDFGNVEDPALAYEVKGLKTFRGAIQFTDHEWAQAALRSSKYFLVVVGNLEAVPVPKVIVNPYAELTPTCSYQRSISAVWRSTVSVS